jgi:hypothetical protein
MVFMNVFDFIVGALEFYNVKVENTAVLSLADAPLLCHAPNNRPHFDMACDKTSNSYGNGGRGSRPSICQAMGFPLPVLCTPRELMSNSLEL